MSARPVSAIEIQRDYYLRTADRYADRHIHPKDKQFFAAGFMAAALDYYGIRSVLDVGSGTGRIISFVKRTCPDIRVIGIEPVPELREQGYRNNLSPDELIPGDVLDLPFDDGRFDLVCAFALMHHIPAPREAITEMLRVAKKGIFISDGNNFGHGSLPVRSFKQLLNAIGLWKMADWIKTKGKGYTLSEGDGLAYSYSVFNNYSQIKSQCEAIHILNCAGMGVNPYRSAGHVALLGIKRGAC